MNESPSCWWSYINTSTGSLKMCFGLRNAILEISTELSCNLLDNIPETNFLDLHNDDDKYHLQSHDCRSKRIHTCFVKINAHKLSENLHMKW